MKIRKWIVDYAEGNNLDLFWSLFMLRNKVSISILQNALTFLLSRIAHKHGGYLGKTAVIHGKPFFPHGLHGVYISRFAEIGCDCQIYQNVTIGEVNHVAPIIGNRCLIGAGAVLVGGIKIGDDVKIGAGAVVSTDIPDCCTVVAQSSRIINKEINI